MDSILSSVYNLYVYIYGLNLSRTCFGNGTLCLALLTTEWWLIFIKLSIAGVDKTQLLDAIICCSKNRTKVLEAAFGTSYFILNNKYN